MSVGIPERNSERIRKAILGWIHENILYRNTNFGRIIPLRKNFKTNNGMNFVGIPRRIPKGIPGNSCVGVLEEILDDILGRIKKISQGFLRWNLEIIPEVMFPEGIFAEIRCKIYLNDSMFFF